MPDQRTVLAAALAAAFARRLDPGAAVTDVSRVADAVAALGVTGDDRRLVEALDRRVGVDVTDVRLTPLPPVLFPPILVRPEVAVVREADLLVLRVSWRGATVEDHVLRPDPDAGPAAALVVELPSQHLMEQAFPVVGPTPAAPALVRAAPPSRLAFDLPAGESVALTATGVLAAMRRLPPRVVLQARPRAEAWLPPWVLGGLVDVLDPARLVGLDATEVAARHVAVRRTLASLGGVAAIAADPGAAADLDRLVQRAPAVVDVLGRPALDRLRPFEPGLDLGAVLDALAQEPTEPPGDHTALELPTRLVLSPSERGGWAHADLPVEGADGTVELWHTRLGTRIVADDGTVTVDEDNGAQRIVRAVWTRDVPSGGAFPDPMPPSGGEWSAIPSGKNPFRTSTTAADRVQIVANSLRDAKRRRAEPVDADALSLTPLGAWTDLHATWRPDTGSLVGWDHRMAGGRDDFVRVVERYYGAPCGFRAVWITETWREVVATTGMRGPAAVLRQREYPEFQETVRRFSGGVTRENPYVEVRVLATRGPDMAPRSSVRSFVPTLGNGQPWAVPCVGIDADGNEHPLPMPMLFVRIEDDRSPASAPYPDVAGTLAPYGVDPVGSGFDLLDPDDTRLDVDTAGRRIAYAPRSAAGDMAHDTDAQRFAARLRVRDCDPVLVRAHVVPPALTALTGRRDPMTVTYHPAYRSGGFGPGEVVLALTATSTEPPAVLPRPHVELPGGTESSGGLAAPAFDIGGLSRSLGVVGNASVPTDPGALLSGARLFGIVPLAELLPTGDLFALPKLVQQVLDGIGAVGHDLHRLVDLGITEAGPALDALAQASAGNLDANSALPIVQTALAAARSRADATTPGLAALLRRIADGVDTVLPGASALADLLALLQAGTLPDPSHLRLHLTHATDLGWWPRSGPESEAVVAGGRLLLSVDVRGDGNGAPSTEVVAEIQGMQLTLVPGSDLTELVRIPLDRMLVRMRAGSKPEVDVVVGKPVWLGVLAWVNDLLELIPTDGFADPPYVEVDTAGARAGFSLALPDVAMGMFCLTNLAIAAEARVPWVGDGPSLWFAFCRRDRPFTLAVSLLGGGGYFGLELGLTGVKTLEASFELGAVLALDFGVASGSVSVMAGVYFTLAGSDGTILGYLRIRGEVDVLGLISASITLAMELGYDAGKVVGRASITVEVSIAFFSTSVSISCEKRFAGSSGDPTFAELLGPADGPWAEYCAAFAPRGA